VIQTRSQFSHERYLWLDQARGVVALLFIVSAITWSHRGDLLLEKPTLGPTWLDHGYNYYNGSPPIITIIDVGQPIFLFLVGFSGYIAFSSRLRNKSRWAACRYAVRRVLALYLLSIAGQLIADLGGGAPADWRSLLEQFNWKAVFLTDVLAVIALGAASTYLSVLLISSADWRAWFALALLVVHAFLQAMLVAEHQPFIDSVLGWPQWSFRVLSLSALSILGSSFGQWIHDAPGEMRSRLQKRVMPVACGCLVLGYCMEWVQPSEHHGATMALMLLAAGLSGLLLVVAIAMGEMELEVPLLTGLGRNLLLVFILAGVLGDFYFRLIPDWLVYDSPWAALGLLGLAPICAIVALTRLLEKYGIALRV